MSPGENAVLTFLPDNRSLAGMKSAEIRSTVTATFAIRTVHDDEFVVVVASVPEVSVASPISWPLYTNGMPSIVKLRTRPHGLLFSQFSRGRTRAHFAGR